MASNQPTFTGFEPEMQDISRQRDLAKLLLQKGMADNMQGQMVSGRYVGASPLQGIANMYSAYKGKQLAEESDTKQAELAQKLRQVQSQEAQDILGALRGTPEQTVYGAGMEGPTMSVTPAVEGSQQAALAKALSGRSPFSQTMAAKLMEQQFKEPKWEKVEKLDDRGNTIVGMVNVNSSQPENTFRAIGTGKQAISPAEAARLTYEGIPFAGGGVVSGGSSVPTYQTVNQGSPVLAKPQANQGSNVAPMPIYAQGTSVQPNIDTRGMSPKQIQELKGGLAKSQAEDLATNTKNANEAYETISKAITELPKSTSGGAEGILTGVQKFFGASTEASQADAKLKVLGAKLTMQVLRFSGPQSDKDVAQYKEAAGAVSDSSLPYQDRMAALEVLASMHAKYAPNKDWSYGGKFVSNAPEKPKAEASNQVATFKSEADAQAAFNSGKLKKGQRVTINGVTGTWN